MIDWARVDELRDEVGAEDFGEVVDLFLEEVEEVTTRLRNCPDPAQLDADLHFLKGSALNLGFCSFGRLCGEGETAAAKGAAVNVDISAIIGCYNVSKADFLKRLGDLKAA